MDHKILDKYFKDQCSKKELEQVLDWFQTDEGRRFLEKDIERQNQQFDETEGLFLYPQIESENIFSRIQRHKKRESKQDRWYVARAASILLMVIAISLGLYWSGVIMPEKKEPVLAFTTYATAPGQQKMFTLPDGIKIRLDEKSTLIVPKYFHRNIGVRLKGEAYFEVTHDTDHPFVVNANGAVIKDLGTKFDVKTDSADDAVQVAVIEGKVMLKKEGENHQTSVILTHNHFGMLDLSDGRITIEKGNVKNYLSWMTNRLVFHGESLGQISRQLERLYNVNIGFQSDQLKKVNLTANFEKSGLRTVLKIIARTLDIHFKMNNRRVIWMK